MTSKAKKNKKTREIRLYSSQGTGEFYNFTKSKHRKEQVSVKKYDKKLMKHVLFVEKKKK